MTENNEVEDIGLLLKNKREKLGYSLQDIAQNTCIRKTYLESIENNQFSDLPGKAYVTGFVKAYARYLDVDCTALLEQLQKDHFGVVVPPFLKPINSTMRHSTRSGKSSSMPGWRVLVIISLFALAIGASIYFLLISPGHNPAEVSSNIKLPERESGRTPDDAALTPKSNATSTAQDVVTPPVNTELPAPVEVRPAVKASLPLIPAGGTSLRMLALSEGSLIIDIDDRKSRQYKLHSGLDLVWDVKQTVKIELAKLGTARFWLGDQPLDVDEMDSFELHTTSGE